MLHSQELSFFSQFRALQEVADMSTPDPVPDERAKEPRYVAGENFRPGDGSIRPYVVLVPTDSPIDDATLMKMYITDVLARNGVRVSPETIDKLVQQQRGEDGSLDFNADKDGTNAARYRDLRGPTDGDLNVRGSITGYGGSMTVGFQQNIIERALAIEIPGYGTADPASSQQLIDAIAGMKNGATAANNGPLKEALDTMENILKSKQEGNPVNGMEAGMASLKFLAEIGKASGLDEKAFEVFSKFAKGVGVPMDIYKFGENTWKVINPNNGLTAGQRTVAATEAAENVLSIGEAFGTKTPLMVPIMSIRMMAETVDLAIKAINANAENNLNMRINDGNTALGVNDKRSSQERIDAIDRRIGGMPTNTHANALGTCVRIIDTFKDLDTHSRFYQYLKQRIEPDSVLQALNEGKDPGLSTEKLRYLAERMKGMTSGFMKAEQEITKGMILGDGAGKLVKEYSNPADHLKIPPKPSEIVDTNKPVPQKSKEPLPDLLPKYDNPLDPGKWLKPDIERQMQTRPGLQGALPADPEGRIAASLTKAGVDAGFQPEKPVQVVLNRDGSQLIAFQGDPSSGNERRASIDIQRALTQPLPETTAQNAEAARQNDRIAGPVAPEETAPKGPRIA
jgi:hypothetical protein